MNVWKRLKKPGTRRLLLLALLALISTVLLALAAAGMAAFTSSLHAQRTIAAYDTEGIRYSSNYLLRGHSRDNVRTVFTTNTAFSPLAYMTVCNYQQGKQTMPNPDPFTYTLTARLVYFDDSTTEKYVPADAAYMTAHSLGDYYITISDGTNTVTLNSSHLTDSTLNGTMPGGTAKSDSYLISFCPAFAANEPNLYLEVISTPSAGTLPDLCGVFTASLRAEGASNHWTGSFRDNTATAPAGYDGFNYLISGTGQGTVTITWDSDYVDISHVSLEALLALDGASLGTDSITFPVDSDVESRYDLQFYKTEDADFTGVSWQTMNESVLTFTFT